MNILLVLAHPNEKSFNAAIARVAVEALEENGHCVMFHDLYRERFDPFLPTEEFPRGAELPDDIRQHCDEIATADGIIVVHPNWWGQPPAVLKGWVDRVIRPGVAYGFNEGDNGEGVPVGLLRAESAIVFNTGNTTAKREQDVFGDPLERIWRDCIFGLCGVTQVHRRLFGVIVTSTPQQRAEWLAEVKTLVKKIYSC